jgi:hypothetical protein
MIKVVIKNNLKNVAGSLKTNIPISTVPTAPIPVKIEYAVPTGNVWVAFTSKLIPIIRHMTNPIYQYIEKGGDVFLAFPKQKVNNTSKTPDNIKKNQFIFFYYLYLLTIKKQIVP